MIIKGKDIELIDISFPKQLNKNILSYLISNTAWRFATDRNQDELIRGNITKKNGFDYGFFIRTYDTKDQYHNDPFLNNIAKTIKDMINEKSEFDIGLIRRIYWNMYVNSSVMEYHQDQQPDKNCISIVYNLHTNDGGTNFKDYKTIPSKESQAIIFNSHKWHKGVAPKNIPFRFCVNIVCENNDKIN
tara:strand:- start:2449 stop:3012 length:564 start_codon:yes stop_codon:yes gene_type:complete